MAFRRFHQEATFKDPDIRNPLPFTAAIVNQSIRMGHQDRVRKEKAAQDEAVRRANLSERYKYDAGAGNYAVDNKYLGEVTKQLVTTARNDIRTTGQVSDQVKRFEVEGKVAKAESDSQWKLARNIEKSIMANTDKYYDRQSDLNRLRIAEYGEKGEVDFRTRGQRLESFEPNSPDSFRFDAFMSDYLEGLDKDQVKRTTTIGPNTTGETISGQFIDAKGNATVTDTDAINFIEADGRVSEYYDNILMDQIEEEVTKMKASNDPSLSWMKWVQDEDIMRRVIENPSVNTINKTPYGARKRALAKRDLMARQDLNRKVDHRYDAEKKNRPGGVTNTNIGHEYSFGSSVLNAVGTDGQVFPNFNGAPGGVVSTRSGNPVKMTTNTPDRLNINTGSMSRSRIGFQNFNLSGYKLQAFTKDGRPVANNSQTQEDLLEWISGLDDSAFDPDNKSGLAPQMLIAFEGYTLDRTNVVNSLNKREGDIDKQIEKAEKAGNKEKVAELQGMKEGIDQIKSVMTQEVDDEELIDLILRKGVGIQSIQSNEMFLASDNDMAKLSSITGGLDLRDKSKWSDDMKKVYNAYIERYNQAKANGFGKKAPTATGEQVTLNASEFLKGNN